MKKLKALLWIPVPILLYWALKDIRFPELLARLAGLRLTQIALLAVVNLAFVLILTLRWAVILRGLTAPVGFLALLSYRLAGYAVSYLTPGPQFGGEPLQLYLAKKQSALAYEVGSASILLDKSFELMGNFAFLGLAYLAIRPLGVLSSTGWQLALPLPSLLIALPAAYLTAIFIGLRPLSWCTEHLPFGIHSRPGLQKLTALMRASESRIAAYCRRPGRTVLQILLFFLAVWAVSLAELRLVLHFFGISPSLRQTLLILAGAKLAFLLPLPGALGALELTYVAVFELLGYGAETGMSLVLYMRVRDLLFAAAGGISAIHGLGRKKPLSR